MPVDFEIEIDESGLIRTIYRLHIEKQGNPQLGISYLLPSDVENLAWKRSLLWCVYPTDQIGRPEGVAYNKALANMLQSCGSSRDLGREERFQLDRLLRHRRGLMARFEDCATG